MCSVSTTVKSLNGFWYCKDRPGGHGFYNCSYCPLLDEGRCSVMFSSCGDETEEALLGKDETVSNHGSSYRDTLSDPQVYWSASNKTSAGCGDWGCVTSPCSFIAFCSDPRASESDKSTESSIDSEANAAGNKKDAYWRHVRRHLWPPC